MGKVVSLIEINKEIVQIVMHERSSNNMFTNAFIEDFTSCFEKVNKSSTYKVAILTGYDNYFSSGGTKEELESIYEGKMNFDDLEFYKCPLNCNIPVISAMQGHAIGGGFALGLYSDIIILSAESIYTCNFMKYGFTPGLGSTFIVPFKLGQVLGNEMLLTAKNYQGAELKKRGISLLVTPRDSTLNKAIELATEMASHTRLSLELLKSKLTVDIKDQLKLHVAQELEMHDITFRQPEVKQRIDKMFNKLINNR
jgi:polyketide biosynthesis enoyl-CoA hydratase PksI